MGIKLPQITLVAVGDTQIEGMHKAIDYSSREIEWGAKLVIQPRKLKNIDDWSKYIVFELGESIKTEFALLIHPDGFVVHPESWSDDFLNYDFVGSPWPLPTDDYSYRDKDGVIQRVGNSVSLRSKRLLDLPKQIGMEWKSYYGNYHEDGFICCHNRHEFTSRGMTFAPLEVAARFGREVPIPENENLDPFVFHKHQGRNAVYPNFEA